VLETLRLDGKTAIVTGAGRSLGKTMTRALAQAGAEVVCAALPWANRGNRAGQMVLVRGLGEW